MSKRSSWRGLHELADARTQAGEIERLLEGLLKEHRSLSAKEIKEYAGRLLSNLSDTQSQIESLFSAVVDDLESHRKKLLAEAEFLKRHYRKGRP
jgi:hypothetical protein